MKTLATTAYYQINLAIVTDDLNRLADILQRIYLIIGAIIFIIYRIEAVIYYLSEIVMAIETALKIAQIIVNVVRFAL